MGLPQFSQAQGSNLSSKTKCDPPIVSQALTLQRGHQVKDLPRDRPHPSSMDPCGRWDTPTLCGSLSLSRILHTGTELPLLQSRLVAWPPNPHPAPSTPVQRPPTKVDPFIWVRIPDPLHPNLSRSRDSYPRSESPRPRSDLFPVGFLPRSDPAVRVRTHLAGTDTPSRCRQRGGQPRCQGPAAMAAMAAVLRRPGGRFRWRTQVVAGGVRSATGDAAGRAGPGRGCRLRVSRLGCTRGQQCGLGQESSSFQPPSIAVPGGETAWGPCRRFCWVK